MNKNYLNRTIPKPVDAWNHVMSKANSAKQQERFKFYDVYEKYRIRNGGQEYKRLVNEYIKGCYILFENGKAVYVGISKDIINRIKQHFCGKTHNTASYVYLRASQMHGYSGERSKWKEFDNYRLPLQNIMRENWEFSVIKENDDTLLYLLEVCLAMELKTYWNSFHTH